MADTQKLAVNVETCCHAKVTELPGATSLNKGVSKLQIILLEYTEMEVQTISTLQ